MSNSVSVERLMAALRKDPALAFELKQALRKLWVIGPWEQVSPTLFIRREAGGATVGSVQKVDSAWKYQVMQAPDTNQKSGTCTGDEAFERAKSIVEVTLESCSDFLCLKAP